MTDFGLTEDGFVPKTIAVIRAEIQDAVRSALGASIDVGDKSIIGHIIGIASESIASVWEMGEAVNSSQDPDKATGVGLEAICALTGTFRTSATFSAVNLLLSGDASAAIATGSIARTASTQLQFITTESATLVAADAWDTSTDYAVGDIASTGGQVYYCYVAADNTIGEPTHTERDPEFALGPSDPKHFWVWLSAGDATAVAPARASDVGPVIAVAEDISQIVSSVPGWAGVYNASDAVPGADELTDAELRELRELELAGAGTSPQDAIRADLLELSAVTAVRIFVNNTDVTDVDGMPPHSVEALVQGGTTQTIVDQLFASVAAGIATTGNTSGTATDSQGTEHTIYFSRPVEVPIFVDVTLKKDPDEYEGDTAVKDAIAAMDDDQTVGLDAVASRISRACFVGGVLDVTQVFIRTVFPPIASTTIAIAPRELATFSTVNVTVTASDAIP